MLKNCLKESDTDIHDLSFVQRPSLCFKDDQLADHLCRKTLLIMFSVILVIVLTMALFCNVGFKMY